MPSNKLIIMSVREGTLCVSEIVVGRKVGLEEDMGHEDWQISLSLSLKLIVSLSMCKLEEWGRSIATQKKKEEKK